MSNLATAMTPPPEQLDELSARVAGGLLAHGVRPGHRVELSLPEGPVRTVLCRGAERIGATVILTDQQLCAGEPDPHLAFAWDGQASKVSRSSSTSMLTVPVGPDFLDQLRFWPAAASVSAAGKGRLDP